MPRDWNAASYDDLPIPMTRWGAAVLQRLELDGDERVLDAGCGTGQVTALLLERLPRGTVVALDASPAMIAAARERHEQLGTHRVEYLVHDLLEPIPGGPYDAVFSTATFHWVPDHERLFGNLAAALRPGGRLVAQCGGPGNIARVEGALAAVGYDRGHGAYFPTVADTARRLQAAGFEDVRCWSTEEPTPIPPERLEEYLATVCLGAALEALPASERRGFTASVAAQMDRPVIDYVRLNISARRGA